ncbi:uncharacterized protein LOC116412947 [Galleria mellonella]|uniref:Uncharacterized protein LOC116412947 n=1 Tax=Galleria mellonella TaxID=7137 RepID=A0A6J3BZK8_GALME|nr:uncharacterized protein LOC116412947 [Galleria mellonella]
MSFNVNLFYFVFVSFISYIFGAPQQPKINDQYENTTKPDSIENNTKTHNVEDNEIINDVKFIESNTTEVEKPQAFVTKLYTTIMIPIRKFMSTPKINTVVRNIGTCIVNGAMEIMSYYFPTPLMPLIATAAGMVIPFEPVVILREKMPVISYRRAIKSAVNGFMNTFNEYKVDEENNDPYMTRRFNRRFKNGDDKKKLENEYR